MTSKLPINLENLLRQRQVEGERIEYKAGWNPDAILRTLCAFANDFENLGGGYVVIGQDCDAAGIPVFPPVGLEENLLDKVQPELLGFCNLIQPTKELDLTEGRSTGISKIIKAMAANGSPAPEFETDEERSYFLIRLPVHEKAANWEGLLPETSSEKGSEKGSEKSSEKTSGKILELIQRTPSITVGELAMALGVSSRAVEKQVAKLKDSGRIRREGSDRDGTWVVLDLAASGQQTTQQFEVIPDKTGSVKTDHITPQNGTKMALSGHQVEILHQCLNDSPIGSLMVIAGRSDRTKFRNQVLQPLLAALLIEMTLPDKPTSRLQKYRLTDLGRRWLVENSAS